jgi:hypothetical protein
MESPRLELGRNAIVGCAGDSCARLAKVIAAACARHPVSSNSGFLGQRPTLPDLGSSDLVSRAVPQLLVENSWVVM